MNKLINFSDKLAKEIQKHADEKHRKNFTSAVNELCEEQLKLKKQVNDDERKN